MEKANTATLKASIRAFLCRVGGMVDDVRMISIKEYTDVAH